MNLALLGLLFLVLLVIAYRFYGRWVARQFAIDDARTTPAHRVNDGVDFVPTRPFYLYGSTPPLSFFSPTCSPLGSFRPTGLSCA